MSVRLLLTIALIHDLPERSIDFLLAFPQADLDVPVFMELPAGMEVNDSSKGEYIIELKTSLYGLKQASFNWFEKLKGSLKSQGYKPLDVDPCVFISHNSIILVYVDDCVILAKNDNIITKFIVSLAEGGEKFDFTDKGNLKDYLGLSLLGDLTGPWSSNKSF